MSASRARILLLAGAALMSTGGAAIKLCALNGWQVASFRSGVAAVALLWFTPVRRSDFDRRALLTGAGYAATMILFVLGNKLTTAANTIFLQSTAPLYVLLLAPWLLGEPIRRRDLFVMSAMAVGLGLFFVGEQPAYASAPQPLRISALAALDGVTWALTIMGLRWMSRDRRASAARGHGNLPGVPTPSHAGVAVHDDGDRLARRRLSRRRADRARLRAGRRRARHLTLQACWCCCSNRCNPVWAGIYGEWRAHGRCSAFRDPSRDDRWDTTGIAAGQPSQASSGFRR
jgi:hypothetical protein